MKKVWRTITCVGVGFALGPGTTIPNSYDMLFLVAGIFLMIFGSFGTLIGGRTTRIEEADTVTPE